MCRRAAPQHWGCLAVRKVTGLTFHSLHTLSCAFRHRKWEALPECTTEQSTWFDLQATKLYNVSSVSSLVNGGKQSTW